MDKALSQFVLSEVSLLELLNVEQPTLNKLRLEKGFPFVRLDSRNRVYLSDKVLDWLQDHQREA